MTNIPNSLAVNTEVHFPELLLTTSISGGCWLSARAWVLGKRPGGGVQNRWAATRMSLSSWYESSGEEQETLHVASESASRGQGPSQGHFGRSAPSSIVTVIMGSGPAGGLEARELAGWKGLFLIPPPWDLKPF